MLVLVATHLRLWILLLIIFRQWLFVFAITNRHHSDSFEYSDGGFTLVSWKTNICSEFPCINAKSIYLSMKVFAKDIKIKFAHTNPMLLSLSMSDRLFSRHHHSSACDPYCHPIVTVPRFNTPVNLPKQPVSAQRRQKLFCPRSVWRM